MIASILVLGVDNIEVQEECSSAEGDEGSRHCYKTKKTSCEGKLKLKNLLQQNLGENNIFFIESSPKEVVTPREACTLESAARSVTSVVPHHGSPCPRLRRTASNHPLLQPPYLPHVSLSQ